MALRPVRFVGLTKDVWIPDDIEVIIDIVPSWRTNIRSNQKFTGQRYTTWHDTGNPNSDARGERNYLHSGAGGRYVGYNFAFDGQRIYQLTPLDEVTWHAGTPDGNKYSWGAEQCLNTDWNRALYVGAALHGGLCAAMGWNVDTALVQHNKWWGKHCPAQIRNRGQWPHVVSMTKQAKARAVAAAGGTQPDKPVLAFAIGAEVVTTDSLNMRSGAGTNQPIVTTLPSGTKGVITDGPREGSGYEWWRVKTDAHEGWCAKAWLEVTAPPKPQKPDVFDGSKDVTINGVVHHADKRSVTVTANTNVRRWADTDAEIMRTVAAGKSEQVLGWLDGEAVDGVTKWWITHDGYRMWSGTTK